VSRSAKTLSVQLRAQSPQKVHSPREKSIIGVAPGPATKIPSGQAATQSPQLVQLAITLAWVLQGGRKGCVRVNGRRLIGSFSTCLTICLMPAARAGGAKKHLQNPDRKPPSHN
jgi:hypothetical protein